MGRRRTKPIPGKHLAEVVRLPDDPLVVDGLRGLQVMLHDLEPSLVKAAVLLLVPSSGGEPVSAAFGRWNDLISAAELFKLRTYLEKEALVEEDDTGS